MKKMKKIAALLLAMVMVLGMTMTVFAEEPATQNDPVTGTIEIKDAWDNHTYTIYKILDLHSYDSSEGRYVYKLTDDAWAGFFTNGAGAGYVDIQVTDGISYVTWESGADVTDFTEAALQYAKTNNNVEATASKTKTAGESSVVFSGLTDLGYYLVDSSVGSLCMLTTTDPSVEIKEKNTPVTVDKVVKEDSTQKWDKSNTAGVGEIVEYKATISIGSGVEKLVMHDRMSSGLTFQSVAGIYLNTDPDTDGAVPIGTENYVVIDNATNNVVGGSVSSINWENYSDVCSWSDGGQTCTFRIYFTEAFQNSLKEGDYLIVNYKAKVNDGAEIGVSGDTNDVKVRYGENHFTEQKTTVTNTFEISVIKYYEEEETTVKLSGVGFTLYADEKCENAIKLFRNNTVYEACFDEDCEKCKNEDYITEIITGENGAFEITGLDAGTYYLKETTTPKGFKTLSGSIKIVIDQDGDLKVEGSNVTLHTNGTIYVKNEPGTSLPTTGGMGTTILYVVGGILVIGAGVVLVTRKHMNHEA